MVTDKKETAGESTMLAARVSRFGGPDVIEIAEVARPVCGDDQVVVRVYFAGVGPWDAWVRSGKSVLPQPLPLTLGSDVSGIVVEVGGNVTSLNIGDEIYGVTNPQFTGAYAEYAACAASMIAPKPPILGFADAAAAPVVAVTAWQMLFDHAGLRTGQRVLIHGAAGSVGSYAVQLAHAAGVHVCATAFENDRDHVLSLGADELADPAEPLPSGFDAVIDLVGGVSQNALFDAIVPHGILVSSVAEPDATVAAERGIRARFMLVDVRTDVLQTLGRMFDLGALRSSVGTVLPLADARLAHEMLAGTVPHGRGKIVLEIDPD